MKRAGAIKFAPCKPERHALRVSDGRTRFQSGPLHLRQGVVSLISVSQKNTPPVVSEPPRKEPKALIESDGSSGHSARLLEKILIPLGPVQSDYVQRADRSGGHRSRNPKLVKSTTASREEDKPAMGE